MYALLFAHSTAETDTTRSLAMQTQSRRAVSARPAMRRKASARMALDPATVNTIAMLPGLNLAEGGGMAVTFPAYLAIFLGTLIPCAFLVILYIQGESRKAGEKAGRGE